MKLTIELVPSSCWFSNVRSEVSKKRWDKIRKQVASQAWDVCEVCGGVGAKHPVECHEIWHYDDRNQIQKLIGMVALCPDCHQVKHFGFAQIRGKGEQALQHLMKVNRLSKKEAEKYVKTAFLRWAERSRKKWKLDISHLSEYGIDTDKLKEPR
jgi:hypothetical protein